MTVLCKCTRARQTPRAGRIAVAQRWIVEQRSPRRGRRVILCDLDGSLQANILLGPLATDDRLYIITDTGYIYR